MIPIPDFILSQNMEPDTRGQNISHVFQLYIYVDEMKLGFQYEITLNGAPLQPTTSLYP